MSVCVSKIKEEKQTKQTAPIFELKKIKSACILRAIFQQFPRKKTLKIIKYNKYLQGKLNLNLEDYENCSTVKIEIIPLLNQYGSKFINIPHEQNSFYHIFFNDEKEERNTTGLIRDIKTPPLARIFSVYTFLHSGVPRPQMNTSSGCIS